MSRKDVEVAKALFSAFRDRDHDAAERSMHPEIEIHPALVGGPEGVVYRGLQGARQFWADMAAAWAEFSIDAEEFRDLGDEVLVLGRAIARGRKCGVAVETRTGWVAWRQEGRVDHFRSFAKRSDALAAVGLSE